MKLEPRRVGGERSDDSRVYLIAPLPSLIHCSQDEADAGIKFSGMPVDLGDDQVRAL